MTKAKSKAYETKKLRTLYVVTYILRYLVNHAEIFDSIKGYDSILFKGFTLIILCVISCTLIDQVSVSYTWREE